MEQRIDVAQFVEALDRLAGSDSGKLHAQADGVLLAALSALGGAAVADAYERLMQRARWWDTA